MSTIRDLAATLAAYTGLFALCFNAQGQTLVSSPSAQNFGQLPAKGSSPNTQTLGFVFSGNSTPAFSLSYGADFTIASATCNGSGYISCAVAVSFLPRVPGMRQDAVLAKDRSGNVLATTLIFGSGLGPQLAIYPGVISTVAGTGTWGYSGDAAQASVATMRNPQSIAVDNFGNIYIADSVNQVVRKVAATSGTITTVAGSGLVGYTGDGGLALRATLNTPSALALDGAGNLYIADLGNNVIRKVSAANQQISTVAGGGATASGANGLGDGGLATNALLYGPSDIAVDGGGNLYIADTYNGLIRKVTAATGIISVVAGGGTNAGTDGLGDGGAATGARLASPVAIGLDGAGNLYIGDSGNNVVRKVDATSGVITIVAGSGTYGYTGDLGLALRAALKHPSSVRVDWAGNIYIADQGNSVVRQVSATTGIISTIAGSGAHRYSGDGGVPKAAGLNDPSGLALDSKGNLLIADYTNNAVRKVAFDGSTPISFPTTFVGQASAAQVLSAMNIGNQPLSLTGLALPANFSQQSYGFDCTSTSVVAAGGSCAIAVQFVPATTGLLAGSLTVTSNSANAAGSLQSLAMSGTGASGAVPQASISTAALTFGTQAIGSSSSAQTVTLANSGSAPLSVYGMQVSGVNSADFRAATTCQAVLLPGANCSISVTFSPSAAGVRTAGIIVFDSVANSPQMTSITGTGGGTPKAAFGSTALQFGSRSVGGPGSPQTIALSNSGSGPLNISGMSVSGANAADFTSATNCGSMLAAGGKCSISVSFSPKALGLRTATLTISGGMAGNGQTISLRGTGNAKTNPSVWRATNGTWYTNNGSSSRAVAWGMAGDIPAPADYDGDGKIEAAVYRPSNGTWYILPNSTSVPYTKQFGLPGDIPVARDYDGDGKADLALYRPSNGTWYVLLSSNSTVYAKAWGLPSDIPVASDYDGDGKADLAVYRPSNGTWYILPVTGAASSTKLLGRSGDIPAPADYAGDGKTEAAVFRPSNGTWYIVPSDGAATYAKQLGISGDVPVPGDYDGDGKAEPAVWRPTNGTWYISPSGSTAPMTVQWGLKGDLPLTSSPSN